MSRKRHVAFQVFIFVLLACNIELACLLLLRYQGFETGQAIAQHDARLGWRMRTDASDETLDGFRNPPVPSEKPRKELRILCLGGSVTYGVALPSASRAYPLQLEQLLNVDGRCPPARVMNAGVPGYATHQFVSGMVEVVPRYAPDVVTVMCGINEHHADAYRRLEPDAAQLIFRSHPYREAASSVLHRSATYRWLLCHLGRAGAAPSSSEEGPVVKYTEGSPEEETQALPRSVDNIVIMARYARSRGVRMLLIHEGHRMEVPEEMADFHLQWHTRRAYLGFVDRLRDAHREAAQQLGIPFLEMNPGLKASGYTEEQLFQPKDAIHYTILGNRVAAKIIHNRLQELGWLE